MEPDEIHFEPSSNATSSSLLERVRAQDAAAWERLIQLYSPLVYHWMLQAGLQPNDAADMAQETFCSVVNALPRFRHESSSGSFRGWLRTIAKRKVIDLQRRHDPAPRGGSQGLRELAKIPAPLESLADEPPSQSLDEECPSELSALMHRALELIRPDFEDQTWQAFWQATVDGRKAADIGADLGISKGAVRQAKYRILQRLQSEFAGLLD